jgi:vesicle-fusing ATPase
MQRQWIGLSLTGDQATVEPLPPPPHPAAPSFLQAIDLEVGFFRRGTETAEQFSADEMTKNFLKAFSGIVMSTEEVIAFEFHGQNLKATVKSVAVLDLADEQRKGMPSGGQGIVGHNRMGVLFERTDVTIMKAPDSAIKIKSSGKKSVAIALLNFSN